MATGLLVIRVLGTTGRGAGLRDKMLSWVGAMLNLRFQVVVSRIAWERDEWVIHICQIIIEAIKLVRKRE